MSEKIGNYVGTMSKNDKLLKEAAKELGLRSISPAKRPDLRRKEIDEILNAYPARRRRPKKRAKKPGLL